MRALSKIHRWLIGPPHNPMNPATRQHIALIAFFAWVGLGADGLSSSCYGPEESYLALGQHTHFGFYLAGATALTVFIISLAYNQVIELFPSGGGGYKVASQLIGPRAGLVSGAALIVDYVLTITISVASGIDALFSFIPLEMHFLKIATGVAMVFLLIMLNLRGMKEAIKILLPIFIGFVIIHVLLILYGVFAHVDRLPGLIPDTMNETFELSKQMGWIFVISHLMLAYSQGGGTYTGLEAVSNNVNTLAEPRVKTGKWTMFYMATSLAFMASGILLLYMLWDVVKIPGQTLNASVFHSILSSISIGSVDWSTWGLPIVLLFEAGLLFVAANTGFLGGPAVLANMAADEWVPHQFSHLSSRLVTKNGIVLMGLAALVILLWSHGDVSLLVILYSINVFLTFSLSLLGLTIYWWRNRNIEKKWLRRLLLSIWGLSVTLSILIILVVEKFAEGGWVTVLITGLVIVGCLMIKTHYDATRAQMRKADEIFIADPNDQEGPAPELNKEAPTAIFMVGKSRGAGMHTLLWVQRLFPGHFKNFIFLSVGEVDSGSYGGNDAVNKLKHEVDASLKYFVHFCHQNGLAATSYHRFGTDTVNQLTTLAEEISQTFPNSVFFASKLIFVNDNWFTRWLHNQTAFVMQRRLHLRGLQMVILPMKI